MNSLKIIQSEFDTEYNVPAAVVNKLVELSDSINNSNNIHLLGSINITGSVYLDDVDILEEISNNKLHINASKYYMKIADPIVEGILSTQYGDGVGISQSEAASITYIGTLFKLNTNIVSFNELSKLNVTSLDREAFYGCSSLRSIDLSKILTIGINAFQDCSQLLNVNLSNTTYLKGGAFKNCSSITSVNLENLEYIEGGVFDGTNITRLVMPNIITTSNIIGCSTLTYCEFGEFLTSITNSPFWGYPGITTIVFRGTTVPTYTDSNNRSFYYKINNSTTTKIYVPDSALTDYKAAWSNMANVIYPISQLPST